MIENVKQLVELSKDLGLNIAGLEMIPEIKMSPILFENEEDELFEAEGWKMTYSDFGKGDIIPLAKVSDSYALVQHYEAIGQVLETFEDFSEIDTFNFNVTDDGGRIFLEMLLKEGIEVTPEDIIYPKTTLVNSVDASKRFSLLWGALRKMCENAMMAPDSRISGGIANKLHRSGTLNLAEEVQKFKDTWQSSKGTLNTWKEYGKRNLKEPEFLEIMEKVNISEKQVESVINTTLIMEGDSLSDRLKKDKATLWDGYNASTQFLTHESKTNEGSKIEMGRKISNTFDKILIS